MGISGKILTGYFSVDHERGFKRFLPAAFSGKLSRCQLNLMAAV
jgi:hypothetical protein